MTITQFTTTAELVGNFPNGSEEWLEARTRGIGGSDIGTIAGVNKWQSPGELWAQKTGRLPAIEPNAAMEWGTRLEPVILDKFAEEHPEFELLRDVGSWRSIERPWQLANPDGIAMGVTQPWLVEVKTAKFDYWKGDVPNNYKAQVQWYLDVLGLDNALVVVLFGGRDYREFHIEANPFEQEIYREKAQEFMVYLAEDIDPDLEKYYERNED